MSRVIAVLLSLCLTACGMKTALELPAGPATEPLLGNPKSTKSTARQPAASAADVSTDNQTRSQ